jgi:hypothetical protein
MLGFISLCRTVGVVGSQTILTAGLLHELSKVLSDPSGPVSSTGEEDTHRRGWKGGHVATYLSTTVRVRVSGETGPNFWRIHFLLVYGPVVGLERFLERVGLPYLGPGRESGRGSSRQIES